MRIKEKIHISSLEEQCWSTSSSDWTVHTRFVFSTLVAEKRDDQLIVEGASHVHGQKLRIKTKKLERERERERERELQRGGIKWSQLSFTLGSATWILFLHSNLSWAKSSERFHFFKSIVTTSSTSSSTTPSPWWATNLHRKSFFFTDVNASLCCACPNYIKQVYLILTLFYQKKKKNTLWHLI